MVLGWDPVNSAGCFHAIINNHQGIAASAFENSYPFDLSELSAPQGPLNRSPGNGPVPSGIMVMYHRVPNGRYASVRYLVTGTSNSQKTDS